MSDENQCCTNVRLNELLCGKPDECTCSAKDMTFGQCCKLKDLDKDYALLLRVYAEHCGVSDGRFDSIPEDEIERSAFPGFGEFVAGFRLGIAEAIKAIEESQPPETTPLDCVDAERYRLLRRKFAIISDGEGHAEFCAINLPRPTYIAPSSAIELDTALDRERLGLDGSCAANPAIHGGEG